MIKVWVDKSTGKLRPFLEEENPEGHGPATHEIIDIPEGVMDGTLEWDPSTRTAKSPVPEVVTPRQFRLALIQLGLDDDVEAFVVAQDKAVRVWWEFSTIIERNHPLIALASAGLGKTSAGVDAVFRLAATL